tara:strand:- start:5835 stop:6803 length:969 start_codon:yes stop_codon:yes gene_type:complete
MALPFLIPMLLGAVAGAVTNPEDRLRGALLGGTLGAVTGGLGAGAGAAAQTGGQAAVQAGGQVATTEAAKSLALQEAAKQAGLESAKQVAAKEVATEAAKQAATETAKNVAAEEATKQAVTETVKTGGNQVFNAADLGANVNPATSGFNQSIQAPKPTGFENIAEISANATEVKPGLFDSLRGSSVGDVSQNPGVVTNSQIPQSQINQSLQSAPANTGLDFGRAGERFGAAVKENPMETAQFTSQMLGGGQQQQQAAPVYVAPIEQNFNASLPPSIEERLAMTGGNGPSFVPRGLFEEERAILDDEERLKIMNQQFRSAGLV